MGQEVQVRISDVNVDNNTVNLSMIPAGSYDEGSGGGDFGGRQNVLFGIRDARFIQLFVLNETVQATNNTALLVFIGSLLLYDENWRNGEGGRRLEWNRRLLLRHVMCVSCYKYPFVEVVRCISFKKRNDFVAP